MAGIVANLRLVLDVRVRWQTHAWNNQMRSFRNPIWHNFKESEGSDGVKCISVLLQEISVKSFGLFGYFCLRLIDLANDLAHYFHLVIVRCTRMFR